MGSSAEEIKRMLEQTLVPPPGVTELDPNSVKAATSRLGHARGTMGERYHLASGLTPAGITRLLPPDSVTVVKDFFFTTATEGAEKLVEERSNRIAAAADIAPDIEAILAPCWSEPHVGASLYGVDVVIRAQGALWRQVPGRPLLVWEARWTDADNLALQQTIPGAPDLSGEDRALIFLTAPLTRSQVVGGDRGYRSALMAAGIVASSMMRTCLVPPGTGWRPVLVENFIDRDLNALLRNDGVDRAVVAVIALSRQRRATPSPSAPASENEAPA